MLGQCIACSIGWLPGRTTPVRAPKHPNISQKKHVRCPILACPHTHIFYWLIHFSIHPKKTAWQNPMALQRCLKAMPYTSVPVPVSLCLPLWSTHLLGQRNWDQLGHVWNLMGYTVVSHMHIYIYVYMYLCIHIMCVCNNMYIYIYM